MASWRHDTLGRWMAGALFACVALGAGCTDDAVEVGSSCPDGQQEHPVTGLCVPLNSTTPHRPPPPPIDEPDAGITDASITDGGGDGMDAARVPPDMMMVSVDVGTGDRCAPGIDSDRDGLTNECECQLGTNPGESDTDGDGLSDGFEDENKNCMLDGTETQATVADTDSDGLSDGDEYAQGTSPLKRDTDGDGVIDGYEVESGCLDPNNVDTDGDGIEDGVEDINGDGKIGICQNRVYDPVCAQGEYDPCSADTDGDGEMDGAEVNFLGCRPEFVSATPSPQIVESATGDYKVALATQALSGQIAGSAAHAFDHTGTGFAGFVASIAKPSGVTTAEQMRDWLAGRLRTRFPSVSLANSGRRTLTHDNFDGVVNMRIKLAVSGPANAVRDESFVAITGLGTPAHGLNNAFLSASDQTMLAAVIDRGSRFILTVAVAPSAAIDDRAGLTGSLAGDMASAASVARAGEPLEDACTAYSVDDRPKVDFLWIIDGSGSMSEENNLVKSYAQNFAQILSASNLDWRLGVVSSNCEDIANDAAISPEIKALFPGSGLAAACPSFPIGIPGGARLKNGQLCGGRFTTDPTEFATCINQVANQSISTEYTATIAPAAIHRLLPRAANQPSKLRQGAATVIISVTDEFDDLFQSQMGWRDAGGASDPPHDPSLSGIDSAKLNGVVDPFVAYLQRPESAATAFGIFWVPGQRCSTASEAAAGIDRVVSRTGGTAGNICDGNLQSTLAAIAEASAGLASSLRLEGTAVPPSIDVRLGDVSAQQLVEPDRSRADGWDYDAVTNAVSFYGPNPPQTRDRVVITYKRWKNSVKGCMSTSECNNGFQKQRCRIEPGATRGVCI